MIKSVRQDCEMIDWNTTFEYFYVSTSSDSKFIRNIIAVHLCIYEHGSLGHSKFKFGVSSLKKSLRAFLLWSVHHFGWQGRLQRGDFCKTIPISSCIYEMLVCSWILQAGKYITLKFFMRSNPHVAVLKWLLPTKLMCVMMREQRWRHTSTKFLRHTDGLRRGWGGPQNELDFLVSPVRGWAEKKNHD